LFFIAVLLVVLSGLMNAVWNLLTKRSKNKQVFLGSIVIVCNIVLMPMLIVELSGKPLPPQAWVLLAMSMASQAGYSFMLSKVYAMGDLSQVYPIQRGTGVILIPLLGVFLLGERLTVWGWIGVATVVIGIFLMSEWRRTSVPSSLTSYKPVLAAFCVGLCITLYVVIDKVTLQYVSPLALLQVSNMGFMLGNIPALMRWKAVRTEWAHNWKTMLAGSILMPGSYFLFLAALKLAPVSHLAPIREVGTVFAALFGIWILKEKRGIRRIATAAVITLGIVIVGVGG